MSIPIPTGDIQAAGAGDRIDYQALNGALLLVFPLDFRPQVPTVNGIRDAVQCNVVVLDGPHAGLELSDGLIFPGGLVRTLRSKINGTVLGRLSQGAAQQGKNPPWIFLQPTEDELTRARQWMAQRAARQVSAPAAAPVPQAQPQGYPAQPPAQPYPPQPQGYPQGQPQGQPAQPPAQAPQYAPPAAPPQAPAQAPAQTFPAPAQWQSTPAQGGPQDPPF